MSQGLWLVSAGYDLSICFRDITDQNSQLTKLNLTQAQANRMIPYADSKFFVASNPYIFLYDRNFRSGKHTFMYQGHQSNVTDLCFAGNSLYACSEDKTWQKWEFGKPKSLKAVHTGCCLNAIALIQDKTILITGNDHGQIEAWNPNTYEKITTVKLGSSPIRSIAECGKNGPIVAGLQDGQVVLFTYANNEITIQKTIVAHKNILTRVAASADGKYFATASADSTGIVWVTETCEIYMRLEDKAQSQWIWDVCFSNDGKYVVTGGTDKVCRLWSLAEKKLSNYYEWNLKGVTCLTLLQ
ncbi:WD repeat protein, putative [Trichomonas vaginalis G3]|uniref:WD repeat protein, putative n=1 Tax=Trichomonas vaginalis (strain ATCC PRA-98 / G3) TaxID=412133 RepID=A2D9Y9_TRIV3|nr:TOR signaling [Trichomonas vaginalis G3]EAY22637.1 WD repeat protein, putative [Trichomonas vaginalis G3]KAI5525451.1 TOR signaling [Trichomonas vaginalis G3]|eukprot:XP_001583623.1 WD repeat protein [Trichomonas vaginalis G3]